MFENLDAAEEFLRLAESFATIAEFASHLGRPRKTISDRVHRARAMVDPNFRVAPKKPEDDQHAYIIGESGHTLKGVSVLTDASGQESQRWTKTSRAGRPDSEVPHLPDPRLITKISTLYDADGRVTQQWIAEKPDDLERAVAWEAAVSALVARIRPYDPVPAPEAPLDKDQLSIYPIGDLHLGLLSWYRETGASWDLEIAVNLMHKIVDRLISLSPASHQALIAGLGDFFHYPGFKPVTPQSGHQLDADSRYPKMVEFAIDLFCWMIDRALEKHASVHVIVERGNHDPEPTIFLAIALNRAYRQEPRITIDTSPRNCHYYEFGKCLVGTHHGDKIRMPDLPLLMAMDQAEAWGRTVHRMWMTGHVHHDQTRVPLIAKDYSRVHVESFRVVTQADAWATEQGYRAIRDMKMIVMDRELGEVERHTVSARMFDEEISR